jgi:hypothetical protein
VWRRYWHGLSAAQWTSLVVAAAVALLALGGALPHAPIHVAVVAWLALAAALVARRRPAVLLDPRHVREVSRLVRAPRPGRPAVGETSLGVRCSAGVEGAVIHYTLSHPVGALAPADAGGLARLIMWLRHPDDAGELVEGAANTYHLLVRS